MNVQKSNLDKILKIKSDGSQRHTAKLGKGDSSVTIQQPSL